MEFEPICPPDAVILDVSAIPPCLLSLVEAVLMYVQFQGRGPLSEIRRLSRKHVKVYVWFAGAPSAIFRMYGPERIGGIGDLPGKAEHLARRTGMSIERAAGEVCSLLP